MRLRLSKDHGFSLVETLVATFIFALIAAMSVALLTSYQSSRVALGDADARLAQLEVARNILRDDYFAAINRPVRDEFGGVLLAFEAGQHMADGRRQRLVRSGDLGARLSGTVSEVKRVELLVSDNKLLRRTYSRSDLVQGTQFLDQTLLEGVAQLTVRYAVDGVWIAEWGTTVAASSLPRLAELSVEFESGQRAQMMFIVGAS